MWNLVLKYFYGILRLGVVAMWSHVFSFTLKMYAHEMGGATVSILKVLFGGITGFVRSIFRAPSAEVEAPESAVA